MEFTKSELKEMIGKRLTVAGVRSRVTKVLWNKGEPILVGDRSGNVEASTVYKRGRGFFSDGAVEEAPVKKKKAEKVVKEEAPVKKKKAEKVVEEAPVKKKKKKADKEEEAPVKKKKAKKADKEEEAPVRGRTKKVKEEEEAPVKKKKAKKVDDFDDELDDIAPVKKKKAKKVVEEEAPVKKKKAKKVKEEEEAPVKKKKAKKVKEEAPVEKKKAKKTSRIRREAKEFTFDQETVKEIVDNLAELVRDQLAGAYTLVTNGAEFNDDLTSITFGLVSHTKTKKEIAAILAGLEVTEM